MSQRETRRHGNKSREVLGVSRFGDTADEIKNEENVETTSTQQNISTRSDVARHHKPRHKNTSRVPARSTRGFQWAELLTTRHERELLGQTSDS